MRIDHIRWHEWDAVRCSGAGCELIVGVSAGPRILSFRRSGAPNLLYRDTTNFRIGDWRLYGGHRITVAPEQEESYAPDNDPCTVLARDHELRVVGSTGIDGIQKALLISEARDGCGFDLQHSLSNRCDRAWRGALWAITCVPATGIVVAPRGDSGIQLWPGTDLSHWLVAEQHLSRTPNDARGKIGWHCPGGWLASLQPHAAFVIHCPFTPPLTECVDKGCNLEVFTSPDYVELETLSGLVTLDPGQQVAHRQRWRLLPPDFVPTDWAAIAESAGCVPSEQEYHHAL